MKTKILRIPLLLVAMLLSSIPIIAHDFEVDGIFYKKESDTQVYVTYKGTSVDEFANEYVGTVTIPSSVSYNGKTFDVIGINYKAFVYCTYLTSISIPSSVSCIFDYAFYGCTNLTSISIPSSVTHIFDYAFYGCTNLTSISIPSSITHIGPDAFHNTGWYNNQPDGILYLGNCCLGYKGTISSDISIKSGQDLLLKELFGIVTI